MDNHTHGSMCMDARGSIYTDVHGSICTYALRSMCTDIYTEITDTHRIKCTDVNTVKMVVCGSKCTYDKYKIKNPNRIISIQVGSTW